MDNVFVIGDVHGHLDRLEALLKQEGLLERCSICDGAGFWSHDHERDHSMPDWIDKSKLDTDQECPFCLGEGTRRVRPDPEVTVVQLGDLGHFGTRGSPTGDILCYKYVTVNRWCDVVLWGNHDRAAVDGSHHATDFMQVPEALHYIKMLFQEGRMQVAFEAHDFLITHAGLAAAFKHQSVSAQLKTDPQMLADWLNDEDEKYLERAAFVGDNRLPEADKNAVAIINAIGSRRGGRTPTGGILWRDIEESLYNGFRQIFGHSASRDHIVRYAAKGWYTGQPGVAPENPSYCIDIGGKGDMKEDTCLAGIWLPSEKIVRVDM